MLGFIYTGILHVAFMESGIFTDASVLICLKELAISVILMSTWSILEFIKLLEKPQ